MTKATRFLTNHFGKILTATLSSVLLLSFFCNIYGQNEISQATRIDQAKVLTLAEALQLAEQQASNVQQSKINEKIIEQDVLQSKKAFYPKAVVTTGLIYTSPSLSNTILPRPPSFLGANAITEYSGLIGVTGEFDTSGRLKAMLERNKLLLESAKAGTEIERRNLIFAVQDSYLSLALTTVRRRSAEQNLQSAEKFEANTKLLLDAGEVAPVDLLRAKLQTTQRTDELEQSKANEIVAGNALRVLIGFDETQIFATEDLLLKMPTDNEIENYTALAIQNRPEFAQFEADRKAAEVEIKIAKSERKPQITYSVNGGAITDSPLRVKNNLGVQATVGVTIPIFDWGQSKSRETQARLRIQQTENAKKLAENQFIQQFNSNRTLAISARSRIKLLAQGVDDAEKILIASQARYQVGEALIGEVTDAQNLLISQRFALYQAIYDYQAARIRLLNIIGK
ncbi:TolC family protein [soil metagenome]